MKHPFLLIAIVVAITMTYAQAAKAPLGVEELKKEADAIATGTVTAITSKTQKSTVETSLGVHRDRIYTITINVDKVDKGDPEVGKVLTFTAWVPSNRIPPVPGLQGHSDIPKKGQNVTVYLVKKGKGYEPILPNGIVINPAQPAVKSAH